MRDRTVHGIWRKLMMRRRLLHVCNGVWKHSMHILKGEFVNSHVQKFWILQHCHPHTKDKNDGHQEKSRWGSLWMRPEGKQQQTRQPHWKHCQRRSVIQLLCKIQWTYTLLVEKASHVFQAWQQLVWSNGNGCVLGWKQDPDENLCLSLHLWD